MPHQMSLALGLAAPEPSAFPLDRGPASLMDYPQLHADTICTHAKELGLAAELLVDSTLARLGIPYASFGEHSAYDRVIWTADRCLRMQIKARHRATGSAYVFDIKKGYQRGPTGTKPYQPGEFDILALVALPENAVRFTAEWRPTHKINLCEIPRLRARPAETLIAALEHLGLCDALIPSPT